MLETVEEASDPIRAAEVLQTLSGKPAQA